MATNGINSSQLGFRGIEDLGGGLRAGFNLIADLAPVDSGNVGGVNTAGKFFGRRATVSLFTNAGELRLGRDYTPDFWNHDDLRRVRHERPRQLAERPLSCTTAPVETTRSAISCRRTSAASTARSWPRRTRAAPSSTVRDAISAPASALLPARSTSQLLTAKRATGLTSSPSTRSPTLGQSVPIAAGSKQKAMNIGGSWDFGFLKLLGYYDMRRD